MDKSTDVVVIGNGPSGISLSFMLSGWTPTYDPQNVPEDDLLRLRMSCENPDTPITELNLRELSDGLEGRTSNPVALVFDQLTHPYADIGMRIPSQIKWQHKADRSLSHIVIGKGPPGGVWQAIQDDIRTLSKSVWMELPNLTYADWLHSSKKYALREKPVAGTAVETYNFLPMSNTNLAGPDQALTVPVSILYICSHESGEPLGKILDERATVGDLKMYYQQYIKRHELGSNFLNNAIVTSVQKVPQSPKPINHDTGETESADGRFLWEVTGVRLDPDLNDGDRGFCIRTANVVLATGSNDIPNKLQIPGESLDFVHHSVRFVDSTMKCVEGETNQPVLVVGAGLSAADAILAAKKKKLPVIHVFRETPCGNPAMMLRRLPKAIYPEYVHMYALMCGDEEAEWYKPYPHYSITAFLSDNQVMVESVDGETEILTVSIALVQIGSSPDLSYLPLRGTSLGVISDMNIDSKHNPIDICPYTYQCVNELGMYAMGPLVGDNFIRFLQGGALAITQHVQMKKGMIKM